MKKVFSLVFVLILMSCGSIRVQYDYEKNTNFSNYATYNYFSDLDTGLSPLDTERLLKAFDIELQSKGMLFSEEPDFYINIESDLYHTMNTNSVGVGVGGSGNAIAGGVSIGVPIGKSKKSREIIFNFVDTKKDMLFWEAVSVDTFKENQTPEEREAHLESLINKVLSKYPPKKSM